MPQKLWRILSTIALHTVCLNAATIPINTALRQGFDDGRSNTSLRTLPEPSESDIRLAKPDPNPTRAYLNSSAAQNTYSWTQFITIGIRRTQSIWPGAPPISIKTYSCDDIDYPHWNYLDCYSIIFSGPTSTSSVSISGRWDRFNAHLPYWDVPVHLPGRRSSLPTVPWPPFVSLEAAEELSRGMGHTRSYHTVTLNGVVGRGSDLYYRFYSSEVQPWHMSFHDATVGRVGDGSGGVSDS